MTSFWNATEAFMIYSKHVEIKYKYNVFLMKIVIYDIFMECHRSIHVYTVNILKYNITSKYLAMDRYVVMPKK